MAANRSNFAWYSPSTAAAVICIVAFTVTTGWHMLVVIRKRVWYFTPLVCGGILEVAGYASRTASTLNTYDKAPYILQMMCILVAPNLFAATLYMLFGRLVLLLRAGSLAIVRPTWVTKIFVGGDVVCFLVQLIGGAMVSNEATANLAKTVILVGLMAQISVFVFFVIVAAVFHRRLARKTTPIADSLDARGGQKSWQRVMLVIYLAGSLILIRSLFRFIEFAGPRDGPLPTHEVYLYTFDSLLMTGVLVVLAAYNPADYVPNKDFMERIPGLDMMDLDSEHN